jgi:hypothetical protein
MEDLDRQDIPLVAASALPFFVDEWVLVVIVESVLVVVETVLVVLETPCLVTVDLLEVAVVQLVESVQLVSLQLEVAVVILAAK